MRQASLHLKKQDINLIANCLRAIEELDIFPDWEFQTLFGFERKKFNDLIFQWPDVDLDDAHVANSVLGALNHLLGYPHKMDNELLEYTCTNFQDIRDSLQRIKSIVGYS